MTDNYSNEKPIENINTLITIDIISNSLSIIGTTFIIFMFIKYKFLRSFGLKIIFYLSSADLIWSISRLINFNYD